MNPKDEKKEQKTIPIEQYRELEHYFEKEKTLTSNLVRRNDEQARVIKRQKTIIAGLIELVQNPHQYLGDEE